MAFPANPNPTVSGRLIDGEPARVRITNTATRHAHKTSPTVSCIDGNGRKRYHQVSSNNTPANCSCLCRKSIKRITNLANKDTASSVDKATSHHPFYTILSVSACPHHSWTLRLYYRRLNGVSIAHEARQTPARGGLLSPAPCTKYLCLARHSTSSNSGGNQVTTFPSDLGRWACLPRPRPPPRAGPQTSTASDCPLEAVCRAIRPCGRSTRTTVPHPVRALVRDSPREDTSHVREV